MVILWIEEILHHLGWLKPYKSWDKPSINWCRISSVHSITHNYVQICQRFEQNRLSTITAYDQHCALARCIWEWTSWTSFFFSWLSGHYRTVPYAVGLCWFAWATQSHVNEWKRDRNEGHRRTDRTKECGAKKKRKLSLFYEHIVLFVFLGDCHIHSVNPCKSCIYIYYVCVYIYI